MDLKRLASTPRIEVHEEIAVKLLWNRVVLRWNQTKMYHGRDWSCLYDVGCDPMLPNLLVYPLAG